MAADYQGDAVLADLLRRDVANRTVEDVRALLPGVEAAPTGMDPDAWMALLGGDLAADTREQLRALRRTLARPDAVEPPDYAARLTALRAELARRQLAGFVVPRGDEHMGEYVPARAERLAWLTGFTGSAGMAVVLADQAAIFVDGRYTLQVRQQVSPALYQYRHAVDDPYADWIVERIGASTGTTRQRLGYDPWLHTIVWVEKLRNALRTVDAELVACPDNPIDAVWTDQPPPPVAPVVPHDLRYAGRSSADKRGELAQALAAEKISAAVLAQPDSIAWLLNVRGADVPCTPLPLSFAILHADATVDWFVDRRKLVPGLVESLGNQVSVHDPEAFAGALEQLGKAGGRVRVDPQTTTAAVFNRLHLAGARIDRGQDPCALPKATKNSVEREGMRAAHRRDGAAVVRFLAWLDAEAADGTLTEIRATEALLKQRGTDPLFRGSSFETISGAGPNGAIVHYRVTPQTDRRLERGSLYLVDSGAQYLDGTTDITRTVAVGTPSAEMRERFTLVLKGHIALATVRFPKGTTGSQLDVLARQFLWQAGLDYDHGTGHGVGSYLSVHEGPARISKVPNTVALEPGMVLSNEPGYYKTGEYGIRIENLIMVTGEDAAGEGERPMYGFEVLTLAPIDRRLIEPDLLTAAEIAWVDASHARVREALAELLDAPTSAWLAAATEPLGGAPGR